jgi:hypothetical protein
LIVIAGAPETGAPPADENEWMREFGVDRVFGNGAPGTIRTSDPQIRSFSQAANPGYGSLSEIAPGEAKPWI